VVDDAPEPIGLELADGQRCRLRIGGIWPSAVDDESLTAAYVCGNTDDAVAVWVNENGEFANTDDSTRTVQASRYDAPVRTVAVATAIYVATG
jgi:hypothetical protein